MYAHNYNNELLLIEGGLGDFLQFVPFIQANKTQKIRYLAVIHFKGHKELFRHIGFKPETVIYYSTEEEKAAKCTALGLKEVVRPVPRTRYFETNPFPPAKPLFKDDSPVVGIHLHASKIAQFWLKALNLQPKNLPPQIVEDLAKDYNIILFGLPDDLLATKIKQSDRITLVSFLEISKSFSYVSQCKALVGSDSCFKTLSVMQGIPTFVWIGDHEDGFRDQYFVDPYVKDGTMGQYRFHVLADEYDKALAATKEYLTGILK